MGKKGVARGVNDVGIEDVVAFTVTGRRHVNVNFLPRIPGLPLQKPWIGNSNCNFHLTSSQFFSLPVRLRTFSQYMLGIELEASFVGCNGMIRVPDGNFVFRSKNGI